MRALTGLCASAISYIGINYIFDRLDGLKKIKQDNNQIEMQGQV